MTKRKTPNQERQYSKKMMLKITDENNTERDLTQRKRSGDDIIQSMDLKSQKEIDRLMGPYVKLQQDMVRWAIPYVSLSEKLAGSISAIKYNKEFMEWNASISKVAEEATKFLAPLQGLQLRIARELRPMFALGKEANDMLIRFAKRQWEIRNAFAHGIEARMKDINLAQHLKEWEKVAKRLDQINRTGQLALAAQLSQGKASDAIIDKTTAYSDEVDAAVTAIIDAVSQNENSVLSKLDIIAEKLDGLKDSKVKTVVFYILLPMIVLVIWTFVEPYIKNARDQLLQPGQKAIVRKIQTSPDFAAISNLVNDYRIVTVEVLNVRKKPSQKSQRQAQLPYATLVREIEWKRDWTLIEYRTFPISIDTETGWVFSRYLRKIIP